MQRHEFRHVELTDRQTAKSPASNSGFTIALIGLVGVFCTLSLSFMIGSNQLEHDPTNAFVPLANGFSYFVGAAIFFIGGLVSSTLSIVGLALCLLGKANSSHWTNTAGIFTGMLGPILLLGYFILATSMS